jgi:hypothetical protein
MAKRSDDIKENIKFAASVTLLALGVIIVFVSLFLPPKGVIDASVLTLIGENFCFVGAVWGIGQYTKVQIAKIEQFGDRQSKREEQ